MATVESPTVDNGVNVTALLGAREAFTEAPTAAQFQWRARCEWIYGTHSRSTVYDFSGLGGGRSKGVRAAHRREVTAVEQHRSWWDATAVAQGALSKGITCPE